MSFGILWKTPSGSARKPQNTNPHITKTIMPAREASIPRASVCRNVVLLAMLYRSTMVRTRIGASIHLRLAGSKKNTLLAFRWLVSVI